MSDIMLAPFECAVHGQQTHNGQGGRETISVMYHARRTLHWMLFSVCTVPHFGPLFPKGFLVNSESAL